MSEDPLKGSGEEMKPPDAFSKNLEINEAPKKSRHRKRKHSKQQNNKSHQQGWKSRYGRQKSTNANNYSGKKDSEKRIRRNTFNNINSKVPRKRLQSITSISKFYLPMKRPRKDIIPPTKFLLGGNISDPLNLNSLQDEDVNRAMNALTPKSSPLPTPPRFKVEVIIPPNICDPLNLLHPVDAKEYEKQLSSPLKRRTRNRKRNKRRAAKQNASHDDDKLETDITNSTAEVTTSTPCKDESLNESTSAETKPAEKAVRDLKLDLSACSRKRRDSECDKSKDGSARKLRRMDSMDKIVSPVIPQPGAWMRPHRGGSGPNWRGRGRCRTNNGGPERNSTEVNQEINENVENKEFLERKTGEVADQEAEEPAKEPTRVFKKEDRKFQYGNYDRYYGYRNLNENMDVRLKVFLMNSHLFNGKDILDIGCNVGHMAISAAKDLHAKSVTGIDIDKKLIERAKKNLRQYVLIQSKKPTSTVTSAEASSTQSNTETSTNHTENTTKSPLLIDQRGSEECDNKSNSGKSDNDVVSTEQENKPDGRINTYNKKSKVEKIYFPVSFPVMYGPIDIIDDRMDQDGLGFPYNVVFKQGNYVLKDETLVCLEPAQYDLIMCLSVSKWLHLNFGDAGLKLAFKRMFAQLRPGGKLILEAQNWASYKKKRNLTETIYHHYRNIEFYPNKFHDYLLSPEVGFSQCTVLGVPQHLSKGFRRPIHLYIKGDFTPSQVQWSDTHIPSQRTPNVCDPNIKKQVYASVVTPSYMPSAQGARSARTPYTPSIGYSSPSPYYYNPRSDSYTPSYSEGFRNVYQRNLGSLWSPNQRYTPTQSPRFTPSHMTPSHTSSTDSTKRVYAMASPRSGSDSNTGTPHHSAQSPLFGGEYSRNVNYYSPTQVSPTQVFSPQVSEPADLVDNMDQETRSTEENSPRVNGQNSVLSSPVGNALDIEENNVIDENEVQEDYRPHQSHTNGSLNDSPASTT